jgi:nitroimidazol reductase NimA-like FMN-containing flavoprotein (pyridoxamine 5'-phosphate oxidase superfamily)
VDTIDTVVADLRNEAIEVLRMADDMTIATVRADGFPQATTVSYVSDGLNVCFGSADTSQKTKNIARCNKVSLTVNLPYKSWDHIRGVSIGGYAERVTDTEEIARISSMMFAKFPQVAKYMPSDTSALAFFKVRPCAVALLDYTKGFGHTDYFSV